MQNTTRLHVMCIFITRSEEKKSQIREEKEIE